MLFPSFHIHAILKLAQVLSDFIFDQYLQIKLSFGGKYFLRPETTANFRCYAER